MLDDFILYKILKWENWSIVIENGSVATWGLDGGIDSLQIIMRNLLDMMEMFTVLIVVVSQMYACMCVHERMWICIL